MNYVFLYISHLHLLCALALSDLMPRSCCLPSSFNAELYHYSPRHASSFEDMSNRLEGLLSSFLIRATKPYSLPEELAKHVSLVDKLLRLPRLPPPTPVPLPHDSPVIVAAEGASSAAVEMVEDAMEAVLPRRRLGVSTSNCTEGSSNCTTTTTTSEGETEEDPFMQCAEAAPACKDATTPAVLRARYTIVPLRARS
jgi:hypothetical protein